MTDTNPPATRLTLAAATEAAGLNPQRRYWIAFALGVTGLALILSAVGGVAPFPIVLVGLLAFVISSVAEVIGIKTPFKASSSAELSGVARDYLFQSYIMIPLVTWFVRLGVLCRYLARRVTDRS